MSRLLALILASALLLGSSVLRAQTYDPLAHPSGEPAGANGIYDPSLEYLPDGSMGWLFYSAVDPLGSPAGVGVGSRVAVTTNRGADWSFVGAISSPFVATLPSPDPNAPLYGLWNSEVTSAVHDPSDPDPNRVWKVFIQRIFRQITPPPETNRPDLNWIVFRTAPDPAGPWSPEIDLFRSTTVPPPSIPVHVDVNQLDPNGTLLSMFTYSEPGAFARDGVLYLSLTALTLGGSDRVILLASDNHGQVSPAPDWRYVATLATNGDAQALGYVSFDGTAIVEHAGRVFLLATPKSSALAHDGTLVFEFSDLASGTLERSGGALVVKRHIPAQPSLVTPGLQVGGGQSTYHRHNTAGGMLMPQFTFSGFPEIFQTYETHQTPLGVVPIPVLGTPLAAGLLASGPLAMVLRR